MRIEKQQEADLAARKGSTGKTIIQSLFLLISFVLAYFIASYMFDNGILNYGSLKTAFSFVPFNLPSWVFLGGVMLIIVVIIQFFVSIGFTLGSPEGRRKTGKPSLHSRVKDPNDSQWEE